MKLFFDCLIIRVQEKLTIIDAWNLGANIDMGHHAGQAKLALDETVQFDLAIEAAVSMTNRSDTLIIVTADHAHTMTINGYPKRGNDIFGNSFIF